MSKNKYIFFLNIILIASHWSSVYMKSFFLRHTHYGYCRLTRRLPKLYKMDYY